MQGEGGGGRIGIDIGPALGALVAVEHRKPQMVDIKRQAVAENQHQQRRASQGETKPDLVAHQLHRLTPRMGQEPGRRKPLAHQGSGSVLCHRCGTGLRLGCCISQVFLPPSRLHKGDEGIVEACAAGLLLQPCGCRWQSPCLHA